MTMAQIVSVHSYRGGTGKSNITANLAFLLAKRGQRIAVLDTDIQSPGVHLIFGIEPERMVYTLSDFVFGKCELAETVYDIDHNCGLADSAGKLYLLPSSLAVDDISRVVGEGYDVHCFSREFKQLIAELQLDFLFLDTHPGLNRETLLTAAISDQLLILLRPDKQDYHGTAVLLEVASRLQVPNIYLVVNKVAERVDPETMRSQIRSAYGYEVIGILPLDATMAILGSRELFVGCQPQHPLTKELITIAARLMSGGNAC
ncbi:MAG: MinD/ParA family protein [Nitrococcus mobilis]|nr:MinD/ParA family protein [Nitrococcus mobilis]